MAIQKKFVLTIFGASGSLAHLKIFPAIYDIVKIEGCAKAFAIFGYARTQKTDEEFRKDFRACIEKKFGDEVDTAVLDTICNNLYYHAGQYDDVKDFESLKTRIEDIEANQFQKKPDEKTERLFYLSIPPVIFKDVVANIANSDLKNEEHTNTRLILEKPFGDNLASAKTLNGFLTEHFEEGQIYRIDHYMGKEAVQNMLIFRFTNSILERLFNSRYISNVQITASEDIGIGGRAGYFDNAGITRDMVQPHVMQILSLIAMDRPYNFSAEAIKNEKSKLLKCIRPIDSYNIKEQVVRGQYISGVINGEHVKSYREEEGVKPGSTTESYVAMKLHLDSHRWFGVPFYIRSGKRLAKKLTEVNIEFKDMPPICTESKCTPIPGNMLTIRLQPDEGIFIRIFTKVNGVEFDVKPSQFTFFQKNDGPSLDAYARLIIDAINRHSDLFIRFDEIETAWELVDPIIEHFEKSNTPEMHFYEAGSHGPTEADKLLEKDGFRWINH